MLPLAVGVSNPVKHREIDQSKGSIPLKAVSDRVTSARITEKETPFP